MADNRPVPLSNCSARSAISPFLREARLSAAAAPFPHGFEDERRRHAAEIAARGRLPPLRHVGGQGGGELTPRVPRMPFAALSGFPTPLVDLAALYALNGRRITFSANGSMTLYASSG